MKKNVLIAVIGMAATAAAYGQGKINFNNYYTGDQTTGVSYGSGPDAGLGVGPEISAILLFGPSTATTIAQLSPVAGSTTPFGNGAATGPGTLGGATGAGIFTGPTLTINGGVPGNFAFAIEATGVLGGVTYLGYSPVVVGPTQATPITTIPNLPTALRQGSFTVNPVPEPSILALSGIGAAALMLIRRKE